jgi:hypothetical protein
MKNKRCNWQYTGEFDCNKDGTVKSAIYKTDCGKTVKWTRDNKTGVLFKKYNNQRVPQGTDFYVKCPYCGNVLNIYNPYDDGETWRE